jgi:hypothetical protein
MTEQAFTRHVAKLVRKLFGHQKPVATVAIRNVALSTEPQSDMPWSTQPVTASKVQLIGLARVRTALGDRWPKLADRVRRVAQGIIEKHLLQGDICELHGDDGFLVLFPQLSPEDAKFKSDAICHEIEHHLIGESLSEVSACIAEVTVMGPAEAFRTPAPAASHAAEDEVANESPRNTTRLRRRSDRELRNHNADPEGRDTLETAGAAIAGEIESGGESESDKLSDHASDSAPTQTDEKTAQAETPRESPIIRSRRYSDMEWVYRPVWDFKNATLIMFALYPQRPQGFEKGPDAPDTADAEIVLDANTAGVSKCISDLSALSTSGRRLPLLTQIHFGTIDNARRRALFSGTVRNIPPEFRKLISFEIVGCPHGGLNFGICNFLASLRQSGVRVALRIDPEWPDFQAVERAGAQIVTMDSVGRDAPESEQMVGFEIFAARAANAKLEGAMWGLATRSLVVGAASAGIRYLAGGAVAQEIVNLSHAVRFTAIDLYPRSQRH